LKGSKSSLAVFFPAILIHRFISIQSPSLLDQLAGFTCQPECLNREWVPIYDWHCYQVMAGKKKSKTSDNTIATNRVVRHDYSIEDDLEVGIVLEGWEVKSLRDNNLQLKESYVMAKNGELWLIGAHISALNTVSTHINPVATRTRKLLAHQREIYRLMAMVDRKGYTIVALSAYWIRGRAKIKLGMAKGKKSHDKRASEKDRDWQRDKSRIMKHS
jgi:SsrA-binding protein